MSRKKIVNQANNRSYCVSSILQTCLFVNKTLKFQHVLNECCNYCPINSVRSSVINLSPGCFMLFISICFSFECRSYLFKQKYFLMQYVYFYVVAANADVTMPKIRYKQLKCLIVEFKI